MPDDSAPIVTVPGPVALFWTAIVIAGVILALWRPWRRPR